MRDVAAYRGGEGHWSYILHRLTGVGVLLFLLIHILDTALIGWGPDVFNKVMALYRHPLFRVSEIGLFAAVLFHALNGLRIVVIDFWPGSTRYHKKLFWAEVVAFGLIMLPVSVWMILPVLRGD
jgi:succinate dehydrogenase / fumarate reductase cytochrome b subunit